MTQAEPKFFRTVIVRSGYLRAPLFGALWDNVGPRVKRGIDKTCSDIDNGIARTCWCCGQRILKHGDNTAFPVELGYDENDNWMDYIAGGVCCEQCSQLCDYELWEKITS